MRHAGSLDHPEQFELHVRADAGEEARAATEEDRDDVELHLVHQPGGQVLVDDVGASADEDVLVAGGLARLRERRLDFVGDEGERRVRERQRLALVMRDDEDRLVEGRVVAPPTLPGVVAPGPAVAGPNFPRPMISAPTFSYVSATTAVLAFSSPPSMPWGSRHAFSWTDPVVESLAALAEGLFLALVRAGHVPVK